jgi:dihydropyrimidinase
MSAPYDLVIRGGTVVTATDIVPADVAVEGETVVAIGRSLAPGKREIDASGRLVMPGGIDAHCHVEQMTAGGFKNADTFETATRSAAFGGTTTIIPFAAQHVGMRLPEVVSEYRGLAAKGSVIDYALHMIVADPTPETLSTDIPAMVAEGVGSIKLFMTYDRLKVDDEKFLDVLLAARRAGAMVCVHAENHGMLSWMARRLTEAGHVAPKFHAMSHPRLAETEAFTRLAAMSELVDQPVMIFHVSTAEGAEVIRAARGRGVKLFAETCPQYLLLKAEDVDRPGLEGAKLMFSPPSRSRSDHDALWRALDLGDLQLVSSDHAPSRFDETGKLRAGPNPPFKQIPNGMPGLETRMPLMFDLMVNRGRGGLNRFVEVMATNPARIYNLQPRKGTIAVGADADIAIWDPDREVTLSDEKMHDLAGYTPYAGRVVRGWPETVLVRGTTVVDGAKLAVEPGFGRFLPRQGGEAARPTGRLVREMDPARNFGANIL